MSTSEFPTEYHLTGTGAAGQAVMACIAALTGALAATWVWQSWQRGNTFLLLLTALCALAAAAMCAYCLLRLLAGSLRFKLGADGLAYRRALGTTLLRWDEIAYFYRTCSDDEAEFDQLLIGFKPGARRGEEVLLLNAAHLDPPLATLLRALEHASGMRERN